MTAAALSFGASRRTIGRFPELVHRNAFVEASPTQPEQPLAILCRPGLETFATVGSGPIRGIYQKAGLFNGDCLVLSGTTLYRLTSGSVVNAMTGSIAGDGRVAITAGRDADLNDVAWIATGTALYKLLSGAVTEEDFPDNTTPGAQDVEYHRGFTLGIVAGTQQVYFQVPGDPTWDALSFASAEYGPDKLVAIRTLGDQIYLLGEATTEVWALTGQADPAIEPYGGLNFNFGCRSRDSVCATDTAIIWVDDKCLVRRASGGAPDVISDSGLAEQIRAVSPMSLRCWWYALDGHAFYVLTLGGASTWVFDLSTERWAVYDSLGYDYWRAHLGVDAGDTIYAADNISTTIWRLSPEAATDAGDEIVWEFMAVAPMAEGRAVVANLELGCSVGHGPRTGQGSEPLIGMKYSTDGGQTFGGWRYRNMPATGVFNRMPRWGPLKERRGPYGHFYRFRVSDPLVRRASSVRLNVR